MKPRQYWKKMRLHYWGTLAVLSCSAIAYTTITQVAVPVWVLMAAGLSAAMFLRCRVEAGG